MKFLIDVDELQEQGLIAADTAAMLKDHAQRDTGTTAINMLLAFGAIAAAAGLLALTASASLSAVFGVIFIGLGWWISKNYELSWGKLGSIWMIVGALTLVGAIGILINKPFEAGIMGAILLGGTAFLAGSKLLAAFVPLALESALGGSTGYWSACYEIVVSEPTITIVLFAVLALGGWLLTQRLKGVYQALALSFTRISIILVNMGFWIGSLWGDTPGRTWRAVEGSWWTISQQQISPKVFVILWALALLGAGFWGARNGRRFLVNTVATFGAIHLYTQWFEWLGADPLTVMIAGIMTIAVGLGFWRYNKAQLQAEK
ncbi:hypothetical protein [Aestuariivirga litoralis]|uniref:hypothetical protein n=1 Tax=Aestuariivirga litoralis TaxID=2650924 RepID=UPI0018C7D41D|nr:hypothetical protein [Aestuariivirga litoralis]MBG1231805.1 hypothetical protein [Aestuariivirga litoralis]